MSVDNFFQGNSSAPIKNYKFIRKQSPNSERVKLNFDGSLQNNLAAGGYILRDWRGAILMVGAANYGTALIIMVEGRALRDEIQKQLRRDTEC